MLFERAELAVGGGLESVLSVSAFAALPFWVGLQQNGFGGSPILKTHPYAAK